MEGNEKYCPKCGYKLDGETSSNVKAPKGDNTLPLLLGIGSVITIGVFPVCIILSILALVYGNKYNSENPESPSKAPLILGAISITLTTILTALFILLASFIFTGADKTKDYIDNNWNKIIEDAPSQNEESGDPF